MRGLQPKGIARKNKMMYAAIQLFMEQGYEKTTTAQISKMAGMSSTSFFAAFDNKEAVLLALTKVMFENQFKKARKFADNNNMEPLLICCIETALQMCIVELSEELRELYVMAYSLPTTSEYIHKCMAVELKQSFEEYIPGEEKDFYEMEIATAGITRSFMSKQCNVYFTLDDKIDRHLDCCLKVYEVPPDKRKSLIQTVLSCDLTSMAKELVEEVMLKAEESLEVWQNSAALNKTNK